MARRPLYALPDDNIAPSAALTLPNGTADPFNPLANIASREPAIPFMTSSSGTAVDVIFEHDAPTDVQAVSVHNHNIPDGTDVRLQRNAANSWGAPSMDVALDLGAAEPDGLPLPYWKDLRGEVGYGSYLYTRLHVPSLAQIVAIGEVALWKTLRNDIVNLIAQDSEGEFHLDAGWQTGYGNRVIGTMGTRLRLQLVSFAVDEYDRAAILTLLRSCGGMFRPFLWVRDSNTTDGWYARISQDLKQDFVEGHYAISTTIEEMSIGIELPTS